MTSLKQQLDQLPKADRQKLMYAFEQGFSQHVRLAGNRFLGVNVRPSANMKIETTLGVWSEGSIRHEDASDNHT